MKNDQGKSMKEIEKNQEQWEKKRQKISGHREQASVVAKKKKYDVEVRHRWRRGNEENEPSRQNRWHGIDKNQSVRQWKAVISGECNGGS